MKYLEFYCVFAESDSYEKLIKLKPEQREKRIKNMIQSKKELFDECIAHERFHTKISHLNECQSSINLIFLILYDNEIHISGKNISFQYSKNGLIFSISSMIVFLINTFYDLFELIFHRKIRDIQSFSSYLESLKNLIKKSVSILSVSLNWFLKRERYTCSFECFEDYLIHSLNNIRDEIKKTISSNISDEKDKLFVKIMDFGIIPIVKTISAEDLLLAKLSGKSDYLEKTYMNITKACKEE